MSKRLVLLCVPVVVAGVLAAVVPPAGADPSAGATKVPVTAGSTASGIDAHLDGAASIQGSLTAAAGGSVTATVSAFLGGQLVRSATAVSGSYLIGGLEASATGYVVCVSPFTVSGGNSTTGYLGRCWSNVAYNGTSLPPGATKVPLTSGQHASGINFTLPSSAAISGKITSSSGASLQGVSITAKNKTNGAISFGFTNASGVYKITNLPASPRGYAVCADPSFVNAGLTGFRPLCWNGVAWDGGSIPAGADTVAVSLGHTHTGINIKLSRGAAVSGVVKDAVNGNPLINTSVAAFAASGVFLTAASTNSTGHYTLKGLPASSNLRVCAYPFQRTAAVTYAGKCWMTAPWNGGSLPAGTTAVSTSLGGTHSGINFKLRKTVVQLGSIAGSVTELAGGAALVDTQVTIFTSSGGFVDETTTDGSGHYTFTGLRPSSIGYVVCAEGTVETFIAMGGTAPDTGWAPRCYADVAWNTLTLPSTATKVPLSPGQNKTGVDVVLHVGSAISGTVNTSGLKTTTIASAEVDLFNSAGRFLATQNSDINGAYQFTNLLPSVAGYIVCFDGRDVQFGQPNYVPQCYNNQDWDGTF